MNGSELECNTIQATNLPVPSENRFGFATDDKVMISKDLDCEVAGSSKSSKAVPSPISRLTLIREIVAPLRSSWWRKLPSKEACKDSKDQEVEPSARRTRQKTLNDYSHGYPRLAAYIESDENFMLFRRFGILQARLLLYKQDELRGLEFDLHHMDSGDEATDPLLLQYRAKSDDLEEERVKLMSNIEKKYLEYAHLMLVARDMNSFCKPLARDYRSVQGYFDQKSPLVEPECYIYENHDIVTLKPVREATILDVKVEKFLEKHHGRIVKRIFCDDDMMKKMNSSESRLIYHKSERVDLLVSLIVTLGVLVLLIVPVCILLALSRQIRTSILSISMMILVVLIFTMVFTTVLSTMTKAKRHEVLTAASAYCAVLVVFIGNLGQKSDSPSSG